MTTLARFLSLLVLMVFGFAASAAAQSKLHMQGLRFRSGEVTTYLTLVAAEGTPILGKSLRDFKLRIDGERTESAFKLTTFAQTKEPLIVVAVVQLTETTSVTLEDLRSDVRQLAQAVAALPGSSMRLIGYGADVKDLVTHGPSDRVLSALSELTVDPPSPKDKSLDALRLAITILRTEQGTRRLIVHFSDGKDVDYYNKIDYRDIGVRAEQAGVVIDSIYYGAADRSRPRNMSELSKRSYGVERYVSSAAEGRRKLADLANEINEQYVVTFEAAWTERSHRLQVRLNDQTPIYGNIIEAKIPTCCSRPPPPPPKLRDRWPWIVLAGMLLPAVIWIGRRLFRRGRR